MADLNYDRMISMNAEQDKNTSATIGVWMGNASLTVFSNRQQVVRIPMSRTFQVSMTEQLQKMLAAKPGDKISWNFSKWDPDTKKSNSIGTVYVGRDDKALLYIGIQAPNHAPMKFTMKAPISFDTGTPMSDVERSELACRTIIEQLKFDIPHAIVNTSFKRTDMRGGGNGGGGNSGGGDAGGAHIF